MLNTFLESSKLKKVAVMISYLDGLSILEHLEDSDDKLTMAISKWVSLIIFILKLVMMDTVRIFDLKSMFISSINTGITDSFE